MSKPTETGHYWVKIPSVHPLTGEVSWPGKHAEIAYVNMESTSRSKIVPRVHGNYWSEDLAEMHDATLWDGPLIDPFAQQGEKK